MQKFTKKTTILPKAVPLRLFKSLWHQKSKNPTCPDQPRLDGKLALVTGGNGGKNLGERGYKKFSLWPCSV